MKIKIYDPKDDEFERRWQQYLVAKTQHESSGLAMLTQTAPQRPYKDEFAAWDKWPMKAWKELCRQYCQAYDVEPIWHDNLDRESVVAWQRRDYGSDVIYWKIDSCWGVEWSDDCHNFTWFLALGGNFAVEI